MATESLPTTPTELRVRDPLSEVTRKERRALLAVSLLSLALVQTGLLPTEISALGIKFNSTDQKALLKLLAVVIGYLSIAFILYAASDFLAWRLALNRVIRDVHLRRSRLTAEEREAEHDALYGSQIYQPPARIVYSLSTIVSIARAIFEFILPIVVAAYTISTLVRSTP